MELPGWVYLIVGGIVSVVSAFIYFYVAKPDGSRNTAMALFFFIGMIFLIIGVLKTFFKRIDEKPSVSSSRISNVNNISNANNIPNTTGFRMHQLSRENTNPNLSERRVNRVEEEMNKLYNQQINQQIGLMNKDYSGGYASQHQRNHVHQHSNIHVQGSQIHQSQKHAHISQHNTPTGHNTHKSHIAHTGHNVHTSQYAVTHPYQGVIHQPQSPVHSQAHHQGIHQHYTIVQCKRCGGKNHSTSNYCHVCGNRLR